MNEYQKIKIEAALNNIIASVVKDEDAPASSDMHRYSSINLLMEILPDWKPDNDEFEEVSNTVKRIFTY